MQRIEVVSAISLRNIAVGVVQIPLPRAGLASLRRFVCEYSQTGNQPRAHVVIVKVAAHPAASRALHRGETLSLDPPSCRPSVIEAVVVVHVRANSGVKKLVAYGVSLVRGCRSAR